MPLLVAAGDATVKEDLLKGKKAGDLTYKVHLDGYNLVPFLKVMCPNLRVTSSFTGPTAAGGRAAIQQLEDDLPVQNSKGFKVWETPFEVLCWPMLTNLR